MPSFAPSKPCPKRRAALALPPLWLLLSGFSTPHAAEGTLSPTMEKDPLIAALTRQADAWDKAIVSKDRAAIEASMAEDFRQIDGQGNVEDKASFVDGLVSPELVIDPYEVEDFEIRLYGDVALLSGRTRMSGRYQGKPFASHYRYIDIYVRRGGVWKIVSVQISKMPA